MSRGGAPGPGAETVRRRRHLGRGHRGETLAAWALRLKGYRIVARQYRTKLSEIDIIEIAYYARDSFHTHYDISTNAFNDRT